MKTPRMALGFYLSLILVFLFFAPPIRAQGEPFYKGKQIRIIVGLSSGEDMTAARMLARHIVKHIPGTRTLSSKTCRGRARSRPRTTSGELPSPMG